MSEASERRARSGDRVRVAYTGTFADGTQFDSSEGREPLEFTVGAGEVIPGFDQAVLGMTGGESRSVIVAPEDGYGPHLSEMVVEVERSMIPEDERLVVGSILEAQIEDGRQLEVQVIQLTEDAVVLDGNHPLAGKNLYFKISLLDFI